MSNKLDVKSIIKLAQKHGKEPFFVRDELVIALTGLAYFNAIELSLIRVKDVITERHGIALDGYLPGELNSNGFERYFFIGENTYLIKSLERYICWRKENGYGCLDRELYCGLDPESYLILKNGGDNFTLNYKNRHEGDTQTQPLQMQRLFKNYYLGEGVSITTLMDAFIGNFWNVKSQQGTAQAIRDLIGMTGLTAETLRKKCIRKQDSIQEILLNLYK